MMRMIAPVAALAFAVPAFAADLSTEDVLNKHLVAFGSGDVSAIMDDFNDDSVMITPFGVLEGADQIQGLYTVLVAEFSKPGMSFEMGASHISGDFAFITWSAETADNVYHMGTDTFHILDGKIQTQTVAFHATPK